MAVAVQIGPDHLPGPQLLHPLVGQQELFRVRTVDDPVAGLYGLGGKGGGPHDLPGGGVHQDPVAFHRHPHLTGLILHLVDPLHMGALDPVFIGGDVQHIPRHRNLVDTHGHP